MKVALPFRAKFRQADLSPFVALSNAVLTAIGVFVAAHNGMFADIAGYSAGVGVVAIAAVLACGGTTLSFVTGTAAVQGAVRHVRARVVSPVLIATSVLAAVIYALTTGLTWHSVLLGGLTVTCTNLVEIESAELQRDERIVRWAVVLLGSRTIAISTIVLGAPFSLAMFLSAVLTLSGAYLSVRGRRDPLTKRSPLKESVRLAFQAQLVALTALDVFINRTPFILAPIVFSPAIAGALAVLLSAQQSATALVTSGLYTSMTIRAKNRAFEEVQGRMKSLEIRLIVISFVLAGCAIAATPLVIRIMNLVQFPWAAISWVLLAAAIPVVAINRTRQYTLLSFSHVVAARNVGLAIAFPALAVFLTATLLKSPIAFASVSVLSELTAVIYIRLRTGPLHSHLEIPVMSSVVPPRPSVVVATEVLGCHRHSSRVDGEQ